MTTERQYGPSGKVTFTQVVTEVELKPLTGTDPSGTKLMLLIFRSRSLLMPNALTIQWFVRRSPIRSRVRRIGSRAKVLEYAFSR